MTGKYRDNEGPAEVLTPDNAAVLLIDHQVGLSFPIEDLAVTVEQQIDFRQGAAEVEEMFAEVGARLFLARLRPELKSQVLARQRSMAVQD